VASIGDSWPRRSAIPAGYPRISPYLCVDGAAAAIDFYTSVLGFTERLRMPGPAGTVGHAELGLDDSIIMLADEMARRAAEAGGAARD
jgi:PhnB protein